MSTLASPLGFDAPSASFLDSILHLSYSAKTLLWYGLSLKTREGYDSAISSYILFCATHNVKPWPASELALIEWTTGRIFGLTTPKQGQSKPATAQNYLSALKSYHIDRNFPLHAFSSPCLDRLLKGGRYIFPHSKRECLPITKDILEKITSTFPISIEELNIDTAFKVAWAGFLRMGEFTYTSMEAQACIFRDTKLTRSDITFSESDQHAIVRLKRSKTDLNHTGVEIILAATHNKTCPVKALQTLFVQDPQLYTAPLFWLTEGETAFARTPVLNILQARLNNHGIGRAKAYTGHSFRKGAAQHASDNGMLEQHIQKLGR